MEARDVAGKSSTVSGVTHYLNPKSTQVNTHGMPTPMQMLNLLATYARATLL